MFSTGIKYLQYLFSSVGPHGVHSPFIYKLVTQVLRDKKQYPAYNGIEGVRKTLLQNQQAINIIDYGAGSTTGAGNTRTMAQIARTAAKPAKYAQLLYLLCAYYQPKYMLELGTSLGVSAAYQAFGANPQQFITLEGSPEVAAVARQNFEKLGIQEKVQVGVGNFDETLPLYLQQFPQLDYVFFDGNHRYEPTMQYFNQCLPLAHEDTLFIFDDIRWSPGMEKAWEEIKNHPQVTVTADLFFMGLVFFKKGQTKQHFLLRY